MLVDQALLALLASTTPLPVTQRASVHMMEAPMQNPYQAQAAALLMSPLPVLTTVLRQQMAAAAGAAADGAANLVDFAGGEDDAMDMEVESYTGGTSMVTATAAACALLAMRRVGAVPRY